MDRDNLTRPAFKIAASGSKIPIFTGKASEFPHWVEALKKKARIYQLTQTELVNLAYDYSDGVVSEYIGLYLDDNPESKWGDLLVQLTNQYSDYTSATDAARALIKVKQKVGETLPELASRILGLAKIAYKDAVQREGEAVQVQLAEYFTDAIENSFVREDTARAAPTSLAGAFETAGKSLRLYNRLATSQGQVEERKKPGGTGTGWTETPPVAWNRWGHGQPSYWLGDRPHERGWRGPSPNPRPGCWECGRLDHIRRVCPRRRVSPPRERGPIRTQGNAGGPPRRR